MVVHYPFWSRQLPVTDAELQLEISRNTAIDIYHWLREVCSTKLLSVPIVLGGPGKVVQIDESRLNHKPKVKLRKCISHNVCDDSMSIIFSMTEEELLKMKHGWSVWHD